MECDVQSAVVVSGAAAAAVVLLSIASAVAVAKAVITAPPEHWQMHAAAWPVLAFSIFHIDS